MRACTNCGKEIPRERPGTRTCSDECASARHRAAVEAMKKGATKPCEACGKEMRGAPSTLAARRTCGQSACRRAVKQQPKRRACVVCGATHTGKRKTCSTACLSSLVRSLSTIGVRSESRRASRRRHNGTSYRGKDKASVIARMTIEQGGKCKVCGGEGDALGDGRKGLVLDHDHQTGRPRAMLCGRCNAALGLLGESVARMRALIAYVQSFETTNAGIRHASGVR